ncbi:ATP-binding protein [Aestuariirhabdus litorea]|uniref:histidine kinase n=1 Tax=Aestuariirhabdus litorea TaxID=2528527 RepID=A0A3P3VMZ7_9GAMM|nr:ATP-binding protein [Aestuariirhabdus litorea]RRJ83288.1 sensor histidine kinase [Aestuariirhabdus litorea]RWW93447.1 HAMP domain-containing histidine kinase [Endozoicomonadaceae bacterium GTF-13]
MISFAPRENLRLLCIIRALIVGALLLALIWAHKSLNLLLNLPALGSILLVSALLTLVTLWRLRATTPVTQPELFGQLLFDLCSLSLVFFFSGGATNPFLALYLVPLSIAAATLAWPYAWAMLLLCVLSYGVLLFFYVPLAELYPQVRVVGDSTRMAQMHVMGMWLTFVVSALLITLFVVRMASALRRKQQELAANRERQLRNEQLMAIATLAAGTAHELGTPLSTLKTLLREMQLDYASNPDLSRDIQCLLEQVNLCRDSLNTLVSRSRDGQPQPVEVTALLERLLDRWRLMRPEAEIDLALEPGLDAHHTLWDPSLDQALLNLLNNAADQSPRIALQARRDGAQLQLRVRDYGKGISARTAEHLGELFFSGKRDGMGIGFSLSQATIERLGGQVRLYRHPEQGTLTEIILPLTPGAQ